jgi:hypothetical protein
MNIESIITMYVNDTHDRYFAQFHDCKITNVTDDTNFYYFNVVENDIDWFCSLDKNIINNYIVKQRFDKINKLKI